MPLKSKSLSTNAIMHMVNQVSGVLFPLITFPYISRVLLPEGLGRVNFAQAIVSYFIMIASLGIPLYGTREVAKVRDNKQKLTLLVAELFGLNVIMTVVGFVAFGIFMVFSDKATTDPMLFWICTLPMLLAPFGLTHLFQGIEEFTYLTVRTIIFRIVSLGSIFLFIHETSDYRIYVLISGLNLAGTNLINFFYARKQLLFGSVRWGQLSIIKHLKPALIIFFLGAVISIYTSLDKVMLGYLTSESQVGIYSVSSRLVNVVVMLVTTLGAVLLPRVSYYLENKQFEEYEQLATTSLKVVLFFGMPASVGLFVLSKPLILLFAGNAFAEAELLVKIMGLNVIFVALSNFMGLQVLYPQNKENLLVLSVLIGATINFLLNILLIPKWNSVGAAVATLVAEGAVTLTQIILSYPLQKFQWPMISIFRYGIFSILMGVAVTYVVKIFHGTFFCVLMGGILGFLIYNVPMFLLRDEVLYMLINKILAIKHRFMKRVINEV